MSVLIVLSVVGAMLVSSTAVAHVSVRKTALSIHTRGRVDVGTTITITGKLTGHPSCRANQDINPIEVGTGIVDSTTTDAEGNYAFEWLVTGDAALQTHFSGSMAGVHPHAHLCAAATSRVLRIRTKSNGAGGAADGMVAAVSALMARTGAAVITSIRAPLGA